MTTYTLNVRYREAGQGFVVPLRGVNHTKNSIHQMKDVSFSANIDLQRSLVVDFVGVLELLFQRELETVLVDASKSVLQILLLQVNFIHHKQIVLDALVVVLVEDVFGIRSFMSLFHLKSDLHLFRALFAFGLEVVPRWRAPSHFLEVLDGYALRGHFIGHAHSRDLLCLVKSLDCRLAGNEVLHFFREVQGDSVLP